MNINMLIPVFVLIISAVSAKIRRYDDETGKVCIELHCASGHVFRDFYDIMTDIQPPSDPELLVDMCIMAKSERDAIILFSTHINPTWTESVYEIVIGGNGNTQVMLRGQIDKNVLASALTPQILSPTEFREFCIKIHKDGLIELRRPKDRHPIIYYSSSNVLDIKYFSFSAFDGSNSKGDVTFLYDCKTIVTKQLLKYIN